MNFAKLYAMQKDLDAEIHQLHNTDYSKTMSERLMAFIVELGEFANETRCFKYWSLKGPSTLDVILEEYSDGLHFILSLGIAINCDGNYEFVPIITEEKLTDVFLKVYSLACDFKLHFDLAHYITLFETFLGLGERFGLTHSLMESAYLKKNDINHQRQKNSY